MLERALEHAHSQQERYLRELFDLLRIPSISTLPEHKPDMQRAAEWLLEDMQRAGLNRVEVLSTRGNPVVYGEWLRAGEAAPTVLVYGHYDVQPVDPLDLWTSPPFEPAIRDGLIFARGASDDKGQMFLHIKALESMLAAGGAPVNVKMLFEGEEEVGSPSLEPFVQDHLDLLKADSCLISDGRIINPNQPSIVYALRGMTYMEFRVRGPKRDLHSGSYGGTVHNPAQVVCEIIARLHDEHRRVTIPGFYDKVRPLSEDERAALRRVPATVEQWREETGLKEPWGEPGFTILERIGARPTCEVNGIYGGFMGEGSKTVIPATAGAKVSMRLVADQDPTEIAQLFTDYIRQIAPPSVELEFIQHVGGWPALVPIDAPIMHAAQNAYRATWGVEPVFTREGGSIPIVATFQKKLGAPSVLMGFGLDDNVHSPNEHFRLDHFYKGMDTVIHYYHQLANL